MRDIERIKGKMPDASVNQYETFMKTILYGDFLGEIDARIEDLRDVLEEAVGKDYFQTQGGVRMLRQLRDIFETLKADAKALQEASK